MREFIYRMSLPQKLIAGFGLIGLILLTGISYILFDFISVERLGTKIITQQQPVIKTAREMLDAVNSATNDLHKFLLTGDKKFYKEFTKNQQITKDTLNNLLASSQTGQLGLKSQHLNRSKQLTTIISTRADELYQLGNNYEENHPSISLASGKLNPLALEYLGYINELIDEVSEQQKTEKNFHVLRLLTDIRHSWTQMMSHLRVAMATQTATDLRNVEAYSDVNKALTQQLLALNLDLGIQGVQEVEAKRTLYHLYLREVIEKFDTNIWRKDNYIMTSIIMPSFSELKSYIEAITEKQSLSHQQASQVFADRLKQAGYIYAIIMVIALIAALVISTAFIRIFKHALSGLTIAAEDVAGGNLDARVQIQSKDELGRLADCFNNMLDNVRDSHIELEVARTEAERANNSKTMFLTRMSHELRTPLNGILGFAQLIELQLKNGLSDTEIKQQQTNIQHILEAGWHLLQLVDELLDLGRIEADTMKVEMKLCRIMPIIEESISTITPTANKLGLHVTNVISECGAISANVDPLRLKQVLLNLLTNAIKFNNNEGRIHVACVAHDKAIRITVTDTGPGISESDQEKLFIPFSRLDADKKAIEGTGIGLALCKKFITLMNGKIGIESKLGHGSNFWIELPREP